MTTFRLERLEKLSDHGFINNPDINIGGVTVFATALGYEGEQTVLSNLIAHQAILTLLVRHCSVIEKRLLNYEASDLFTDVVTLRNSFFRMLHPSVQERLRKKGLSVSIFKYVGFDTEYETVSDVYHQNKFLSSQLAVNTNMLVKIPNVNGEPLKLSDF